MISLLLAIALFGLIVWIILQIPMDPRFRNVVVGIAIFILVLFVLQSLGIDTPFRRLE